MDRVLVTTLGLEGAQAQWVELELQHTGGLMQRIVMTGLAGSAVRESRDRIRGCLEQCELPVPRRSVLVNFAPADRPKQGNGFDLPLALGLLALQGELDPARLAERVVFGELALDGRLRPVRGALTLALAARRAGVTRLMLPAANGAEAALVEGLEVEAVADLRQALACLAGEPPPAPRLPSAKTRVEPDLADVRGQASGRRALEVAAAGAHNLLMIGPPGSGKTMLAQRLPGLLPDLPGDDVLEVSALHGLAHGGTASIHDRPPFRAPHHSVSRAGLVGGGQPLAPGEVSLAHRGVLFLDELTEFPRSLLEALRQPLEDGRVELSRAGRSVGFPARLQLVGAMNPCPCGYLGHPRRPCGCTPVAVERYRRRLSGPLLDRFDLAVEVAVPSSGDLLAEAPGEASATVAARIARARVAGRRWVQTPALDAGLKPHLARAIDQLGLSGRAVGRVLAVSRTLALLDGRQAITQVDLDEALSYRQGLVEFHSAPV